jgi:hypothetical protein
MSPILESPNDLPDCVVQGKKVIVGLNTYIPVKRYAERKAGLLKSTAIRYTS